MRRRKFLVCGGDTRSFLAVVRSLGRTGAEVHAAWSPESAPPLHSRYLARIHALPPFGVTSGQVDERWLAALESLLTREQFDLVIPCSDNSVLPLRTVRDRLSKSTKLFLADEPVYQQLSDKIATYKLAESMGVPQPKSIVVTSPAEGNRLVEELGLPVVIKPQYSVTPDDIYSKQHVWIAQSAEELERGLAGVSQNQPLLVQAFVKGRGAGVEILANEGELLFAFQHQRIHEPLRGGGSTYRKSVSVDARLLDVTRRIIKATGLTGVAMFEFRVDPRTNQYYFFEVNLRFWGSLPLAIASGADFPRYAIEMLFDGRTAFPATYRTELYCRNLILDLRWCLDNLLANHRDPVLLTEPRAQMFLEWLNLPRGVERSDTFVLDDLRPAIVELGAYLGKLLAKASTYLTGLILSLPWLRRRRSERAKKCFAAAERVAFVCKGNICRSPFASRYAAQKFQGKEFLCCGLSADRRANVPRFAEEVAKLHGVDLSAHQPVPIDEALARDTDLFLTFEVKLCQQLLDNFPFLQGKVFLLSELVDGRQVTVADPFGGPREGFLKCYDHLAQSIDRFLKQ